MKNKPTYDSYKEHIPKIVEFLRSVIRKNKGGNSIQVTGKILKKHSNLSIPDIIFLIEEIDEITGGEVRVINCINEDYAHWAHVEQYDLSNEILIEIQIPKNIEEVLSSLELRYPKKDDRIRVTFKNQYVYRDGEKTEKALAPEEVKLIVSLGNYVKKKGEDLGNVNRVKVVVCNINKKISVDLDLGEIKLISNNGDRRGYFLNHHDLIIEGKI